MAQEITFTKQADGTWQGSFTSTGTRTIIQVERQENAPLYLNISADNGGHNVIYQPPKNYQKQILEIEIAEGALVTIVSHSAVTKAYYIASELDYYTKDEIDDKMEQIHQFEPVVANSLPTASADTMYKFYFIPKQSASEQTNTKEEWMTVKEGSTYRWEKIGETDVDLSDYVTVDDLEEYIENSKSFKGWFDSSSALSSAYPSPKVGDYAYIKGASASDPAAIYECATAGTWSDSGRTVDTSSVQTFATGEEVNETYIDDTHLVNSKDGSVAMAKDAMNINGYLEYPDYTETLSTSSKTYEGYVRGDTGAVVNLSGLFHTEIELNGEDKVRFLCVEWNPEATTVSGWAFYYEDGTYIPGSGGIVNKTPEVESGARLKEYIVDVPQAAKLFKCITTAGSGVVTPDNFYCYLIKGNKASFEINKAEFNCYEPLFRYDFLDITNEGGTITPNFDTTKLIGNYSNENLTENGYAAGTSFSDYVNINTICSINNFSCRAKIKLQDFTSVVGLGSIDQLESGQRGSQIKFDFGNKKIYVCAKSHGTSESTTIMYTYDVSSVIDTNDTYWIEVGRINRALYAKITNYTNCKSIKYVCPVSDVSPNGVSAPESYPIGCFYDKLTFFQISGTPAYFQEVSCYIPSNVKVAFVGDSLTEGYGVKPEDCWANMAGNIIGNTVNMGRNGSKIDLCQTQVEDMFPIVKPKYAVITIGTNDTTSTPSTIDSTKLNTLVSTVRNMGIIPIINTIYRRTSTYNTKVSQANQDILNLHGITCRFDIATSIGFDLSQEQNTSLYLADNLHLNKEGNKVVLDRFMNDVGYAIKGNIK